MIQPIDLHQLGLNYELREYFESIDQMKYDMPIQDLQAALTQDFPEYSNLDLFSSPELMDLLGIAYCFQTTEIKDNQLILCSIIDSLAVAEQLKRKFEQDKFVRFRQKLNVLSHWIFAAPSDYMRLNSRSEFVDWCCDFAALDEPKVWIINELAE